MKKLAEIRAKIDEIDQKLLPLLHERMECSREMGKKKVRGKLPIYNPLREAEIMQRILDQPSFDRCVEEVYEKIFVESKEIQQDIYGIQLKVWPEKESDHLGQYLKLRVGGMSHGSAIRMSLENFPAGFRVDDEKMRALLNRRAPGQNELTTKRWEEDWPRFKRGIKDGKTTGELIQAEISNSDFRSADYEQSIPRPGHADYPQWVQLGQLPPGGGVHSGRLTVGYCVAGGLCQQWLEQRKISVRAELISVGNSPQIEETILAAKKELDSVGGMIEIIAEGLPVGIGGELYKGLQAKLSIALFSIPGVKGVEFGDGFALAQMRGSQANDTLILEKGKIRTKTNHAGGLQGGMTNGMPLVIRIAMKPTSSIYLPQRSVDLAKMKPAVSQIFQGRHDPCIAWRAVPVAEALVAFVLADQMMLQEAQVPKICMTLTEPTLEENLKLLQENRLFVDMCELRADMLQHDQLAQVADFPEKAGMPVILTLRRTQDGGKSELSVQERVELFTRILSGKGHFDYVDLEDDFHQPELEKLIHQQKTKIIRSRHDMNYPIVNLAQVARKMVKNRNEIAKIAFRANHCEEVTRLFLDSQDFTEIPHVFCAMGPFGLVSRVLASRSNSLWTYVSAPRKEASQLQELGHITPQELVRLYRYRTINHWTRLYAVTGYPLEHTLSPKINNDAFAAEGQNAVMVPIPAETPEEVASIVEVLNIQGIAVTTPHKETIGQCRGFVRPWKGDCGRYAYNTLWRTNHGWMEENTDWEGFFDSLCGDFLKWGDLEKPMVAIIGAGGAARAVARTILDMGWKACVFNRTLKKAEQLAADYGFEAEVLPTPDVELSKTKMEQICRKLRKYNGLIVQTTTVGLSSSENAGKDPLYFYEFQGTERLYDLIYSPEETPVMTRAKQAGCLVFNGMAMLERQARLQRERYGYADDTNNV